MSGRSKVNKPRVYFRIACNKNITRTWYGTYSRVNKRAQGEYPVDLEAEKVVLSPRVTRYLGCGMNFNVIVCSAWRPCAVHEDRRCPAVREGAQPSAAPLVEVAVLRKGETAYFKRCPSSRSTAVGGCGCARCIA